MKWKKGQPNPPHIFWDSDVAKWIEAAAYSLATHPDPALDNLLDEVIARIAKGQAKDGYFNSHYIPFEKAKLDKRFTNLRDAHELYCAGHLFEAAVAHFQATGKRNLLDPMCKYADYLCKTFGRKKGQMRGYCGHQEIELALVKLYHITNQKRYLELAQFFIDERGQGEAGSKKPKAGRDHYFDVEAVARGQNPAGLSLCPQQNRRATLRIQPEPLTRARAERGHRPRRAGGVYVLRHGRFSQRDRRRVPAGRLRTAVAQHRGRAHVSHRRHWPLASNEGFTYAYDLPDETAYAETCASVALVFWNQRLLQFAGDGKYADIMERALFNGSLSGVSLDGQRFFYDNPLASAGHHHRQGWFDCACCPPNIARLIASVGGYFYSTSDPSTGSGGVWVHLYARKQSRN